MPTDPRAEVEAQEDRETVAAYREVHYYIGPSLSPDNLDDDGHCSCGQGSECDILTFLAILDRPAPPSEGLREALEQALPDALSDLTEGSDYAEAPEPSDEPGSPYVKALAANLAAHPALRSRAALPPADPSAEPDWPSAEDEALYLDRMEIKP